MTLDVLNNDDDAMTIAEAILTYCEVGTPRPTDPRDLTLHDFIDDMLCSIPEGDREHHANIRLRMLTPGITPKTACGSCSTPRCNTV